MATIDRTAYNALLDDDLTGDYGSAWDKLAIKNTLLDPIDVALAAEAAARAAAIAAGTGIAWTTIPYSAANFSANGAMTWTVEAADVIQNRYIKIGGFMVWSWQIAQATIGGTANTTLLMTAPAGITFPALGHYVPTVLPSAGFAYPYSATQLGINNQGSANYALTTNGAFIYGSWFGSVNP